MNLSKHERVRVESWCKRLCQNTHNTVWKKNRNLHAILLLDQVLNNKLDKPYSNMPPDSGFPPLNEHDVVFFINEI